MTRTVAEEHSNLQEINLVQSMIKSKPYNQQQLSIHDDSADYFEDTSVSPMATSPSQPCHLATLIQPPVLQKPATVSSPAKDHVPTERAQQLADMQDNKSMETVLIEEDFNMDSLPQHPPSTSKHLPGSRHPSPSNLPSNHDLKPLQPKAITNNL
ncbi:UNVERIFIED_CONTAM: hypothetical protein Sradi_4409600 [Sesamum radiatum]|uniref:Uncharacterized protein n=1 Tax=Sesamum radiatum TaxID=300843 RepID=A0AAW2NR83_SESRA